MSLLEPTQPSPRERWLKRLPAILFLVIAAWYYSRTVAYMPPSHVQFSSLPMQKLDGSPLPPQTTVGKAVILNFWAPWCAPCRAEIPWLQRLQAEHPDLAVIGVENDPDEYRNAGILAAQILAVADAPLQAKLVAFKTRLADDSRAKDRNLAR